MHGCWLCWNLWWDCVTRRLLIKISHLCLEIWQEEFTSGDPVSKAVNPGVLQQFIVHLLPAIVLSARSLTFDPAVHHVIIKRYWIETGQKHGFHVCSLSLWEAGGELCEWTRKSVQKHRPTGTTRRGNPPKTSCQEERGLLTISLSLSQQTDLMVKGKMYAVLYAFYNYLLTLLNSYIFLFIYPLYLNHPVKIKNSSSIKRGACQEKSQHPQVRDDTLCPQTAWGAARALGGKRQIIDDKQKVCKDELIFDVP